MLTAELLTFINRAERYDFLFPIFCKALFATGLRFNELFELNRLSIISSTKIEVDTLKGSNNRIIKHSDINPIIINSIKQNNNLFSVFASYRKYSRIFNRLTSFQYLIDSKPTTFHLFRHNFIKKLHFSDKKNIQEIKEITGIKTSEVVLGYIHSSIKRYDKIFNSNIIFDVAF
jgi:site-specific recombinase XerD